MARTVLTILGCGSSGGVPRLGGKWGDCDPSNPKNNRRRCSVLVQRFSEGGETAVLIDTTPDMRMQLLDAGVGLLDAVLYTHEHADHTHGLDDLRMVVMNRQERLPVYAEQRTYNSLISRFGYAFIQPEDSAYPPILNLYPLDGPVTIEGAGGPLTLTPFTVEHGNIDALGFRIGNLAYTPDVSEIPAESHAILQGLDCWVVDALRRNPHPSHSHLAKTLSWITRFAPKQAVLTNMHYDLDYQTVMDETPDNVLPAYDGMTLEVTG